jgi:Coenzyme PQQ synthesis protein D (PqqD)
LKLRLDDISWREIDGDLVVLDLRTSTYLTTNASGTLLVKELTEDRTTAELVDRLVDAYGIPRPSAERDVDHFLAELDRSGLLEPTSSASTVPPSRGAPDSGKGVNTWTQSPARV